MALFDDTFPPYVPFGSRTLSLTSPRKQGTDVAVLQSVYNLMLKTMNPPHGPMGTPVSIDGVYGPSTKQAVSSIQSYFGLSVDGVAGANTYFVFGQGVGPNTTYGGPVYGSRQLSSGDRGGDVTILQNRLNCFRYTSMLGGPADGIFGPKTAAAVRAFKHDAELNGDTGFPDNAIAGFGFYDASWLYTFAGGRAIWGPPDHVQRNGFDVVFLQVLLKKLGFYSSFIDGYYGSNTRAAVRAFQSSEGISVDGVVGPVTFYHLGLNNAHAAPTPLGISWPAAAPPVTYSDCCIDLVAQVGASGTFSTPPGGSVWVRQFSSGRLAFVVGTMFLPDPSVFNPSYDSYVLEFPAVPARKLTEVFDSLGVWGESRDQSYGAPISPSATVTIRPGVGFQPLGPVVLSGTFASCH